MRTIKYHWHLRQVMANRGLFATTELAPLLAERGIELSPAQVHRLVTQTPERLSLPILVALCDALGCTSEDLIEGYVATGAGRVRKVADNTGGADTAPLPPKRPRRADIVRPADLQPGGAPTQ